MHLTTHKKRQLNALFALNRKVMKAHLLKESLDRLWSYRYEGAMLCNLKSWIDQLRWQRLKPMEKLADMLLNRLEGILNYCQAQSIIVSLRTCGWRIHEPQSACISGPHPRSLPVDPRSQSESWGTRLLWSIEGNPLIVWGWTGLSAKFGGFAGKLEAWQRFSAEKHLRSASGRFVSVGKFRSSCSR